MSVALPDIPSPPTLCAPVPAMLCSGQAWPPVHLGGCRRCFGLRSLVAVSSVASGRIEFVFWASTVPIALRTICSLSVALHLASRRRSYFLLLAVSSTREGLSPSCARSLPSARARPVPGRSRIDPGRVCKFCCAPPRAKRLRAGTARDPLAIRGCTAVRYLGMDDFGRAWPAFFPLT